VKHVDAKAEFAELKETTQKLEDFELRQDIILEKRIEQDKLGNERMKSKIKYRSQILINSLLGT
jgi:hypothetical protein